MASTGQGGRDLRTGQFQKGHAGTGGRPSAKKEEAYQRAFRTAVTPTEWAKVIKKALYNAKKGDKDARKWLGDYLVGVPVQRIAPVDPSGKNPYEAHSDEQMRNIARELLALPGVKRKRPPKRRAK